MGVGVRTWIAGLLIAAALGAAAWWWLCPPGRDVGTEELSAAEADAAAQDLAVLAGRGTVRAPDATPVRTARGTVVGEVRKAGQPAAARIVVYEIFRADAGTQLWSVPDAMVPLDGPIPAPVAEATAGADGAFLLDLPAPARYLLVATGDGRARAEVTVRTDRARVAARLELRGGDASLSGRAVHADGRPFRGSILVAPVGLPGPATFVFDAIATDEEGRFTAGGLDPGPHTVSAFVPGRWRAMSRDVPVPHPGEFTFVVDEGTVEVAGRVTDEKDGRGVPGAVVTATLGGLADIQRFDGRAVADGDGRFSVRAPALRSGWRVDAVGFAPLNAWRPAPPEGTPLELRLVRLARLSGRVTTEGEGAPTPGVTVYAVTQGAEQEAAQGLTDADGRYAIPGVRPGEVTVFAWGNGWCSPDLESAQQHGFNPLMTTITPDTAAVVDLTVRRAARASGRVTDAADAPVVGAQVVSNRAQQTRGFFSLLGPDRAVATDADGRFVVDTLLPGVSYRFEASAPSTSPAQSPPMRADPATPLVVDLKLGAPRWIDVELVEKESGTPVSGVMVQAYQQVVNGNWKSFGPTTSGAGGRARLGPVPPGPLMLWAWSDGYQMTEQPTVGGPEDNTADVQAKLTMIRNRFIQGVVRYADGQPVVRACIRVKATDFEDTNQAGEDGRFRSQCPATAESVEVMVLKDWEGEVLVETRAAPNGPSLTLTVPGAKPPRFLVRVLDPSGRPVTYATAILMVGESTEDAYLSDGRAEFAVPKEAAHILVHGARGDSGPLPLGLTIAGPVDTKASELEVRMGPEVRIEGVVRTADGRPVRGAFLRARPKDLPAPFANWSEEIATSRTDDAGRFRLGGLGAGMYTIRVDAADRGGRTEPVEAKAGTTDLVITLGEGTEIALTVLGADGQPVTGARVQTRGQNTRPAVTETDAAGTAHIRGLDRTAKYRLDVTPDETRTDLMALSREAWLPRDEVVELAPAYVLEGVVRDRTGAPLTEGWVDAIFEGNVVQRARVAKDGGFRIQRLAEGTYRVIARTQEPARSSRPILAAAGSRDLALVLDSSSELALKLEGWKPVEGGMWTTLWDEETGTALDWVAVGDDGTARFNQLHPESRYTVYVVRETSVEGDEGPPPTQVGWKAGVKGDAGSVSVAMESGVTIGVRVRFPPGVALDPR
ncbi:MAG TPA: carboxypeptidase-like regulatory domain-containing protein, partial [Planctomycetota bacterium]|nr:carboxypeptidase-like regulatory domain-containing protein [Planctomycetota bacterium]